MKRVEALMLGIAAFGVCISGSALAQDKEPGSGPNPFTDCGIGAALFPDTHWAAVTSNVIWDVGTTAIISATASPETCQGSSAQAAKFINDTYDGVIEDTARGDGEYVVTLLEIFGCEKAIQSDIVDVIRRDVSEIISADDYDELSHVEKAESYYNVIDAKVRGSFSASCTA